MLEYMLIDRLNRELSNDTKIYRIKGCLDMLLEQRMYLGHTKSSGSDNLFLSSTLWQTFFLYHVIENKELYLSMPFDHTSHNIMVTNF
jgi:hypothetical protein